jgi:hypothetical protein
MTKLLGLVTLTSAIAVAVSPLPAAAQQAAITNIDIEMTRASKGPYGVRAEVTNPNDFAVKDIRVHCTMQDDKGNAVVAFDTTILLTFPARQKIVMPRLDVGAWPPQAAKGSCTSSSAQRV